MDALAKWLSTNGITVIQMLALRSLIIIPVLILIFVSRGQLKLLKPVNVKAHTARGMIGAVAPLCFFLGIGLIPLTDAVAVSFSSVFSISILSIVFLGEKIGLHRWLSIVAGFIGVLIITNPQGGGDMTGYILVLIGSIAYAIMAISGKRMAETESVASLVLSYNLCVASMSMALLPWFWNPLSLKVFMLVISLGLLALAGQYLLTLAFSFTDASLIALLEYTAVLWALVFDLVIWQIMPSLTTAAGAVIVIASGLYITHRERVKLTTQ
jgi:drug/metabolite transporter (DMT)-like permease